jgi:hypothetical protein
MNLLAMARAGSTGTNKPIKDRPIGGLGIHFIRNLTDSQHAHAIDSPADNEHGPFAAGAQGLKLFLSGHFFQPGSVFGLTTA